MQIIICNTPAEIKFAKAWIKQNSLAVVNQYKSNLANVAVAEGKPQKLRGVHFEAGGNVTVIVAQ